MTKYPLLDTIDAFAQKVQGKLAQIEVTKERHRRACEGEGDFPYADWGQLETTRTCYLHTAKMLHTIRAQVEDLVREEEVCPDCKGTGYDLLNSPHCLSCGGLGKPLQTEQEAP